MIIKSKGRKSTTGIRQLLEYILRPDAQYKDDAGKTLLITANLRGSTIEDWCKEYVSNEELRVHKKVGVNVVYHEILSFHELDTEQISLKKLEKIAREYMKQRNPNALVIATAHNDKPHVHIHFACSGVEYKNGKSLRVSRQIFKEMMMKMALFQEREYPELEHSVVDFGKKKE